MSTAAQIPCAAMILAAGRGERMRPLTDTIPKPLLAVRGQPLIERHVAGLAAAGIHRIVINLAWLGAQIRAYLGDGARYGAQIVYSDEAPQALDTAGGIIRALPHLQPGPFAVVNGDVFSDFPLATLRLAPDRDAHLIMVPNPVQHPQGDFALENGLALPGSQPLVQPRFTFSGIAVYRSRFFEGTADGVMPMMPLWLRCMSARRCSGALYDGFWQDVGTPQRLADLNA